MRNLGYILLSVSILLITIGVILQLIKNDCDNKTITEYFKSDVCVHVGNR